MDKEKPEKKIGDTGPNVKRDIQQHHDEQEHHHKELFIIHQDGAVEEVDLQREAECL